MARGAFWTIIVDEQPTAFRAPVREDLLPTLKQLQRQNPSATIKWFQRGRLWETPGDAMDASKPPRRGTGWRPGGEHKDPREAYKVPRDVKRARWASQAADGRGPWVKDRNAERRTPNAERGERHGRADGPPTPRGEGGWKPKEDRASGAGFRAPAERGERSGWKPKGDRPAFKPRADRPDGDRTAWKPKGEGRGVGSGSREAGSGERPAWKPKGDRPFTPRGDKPAGDRPAWKPKGDRPFKPREDRAEWKPKSDRPGGPPKARGEGGWKPREDSRAPGDRPAFKPKGEGRGTGSGYRGAGSGERPAWKPKPDRPAFKPRSERPDGDGGGFTPKGDRPAWKPSGPGIRRGAGTGTGTGAPRADWRERGTRGDATPRSGGDAPKPPAKRGKTWRVGELPPADRKKKKDD